MSTFTVMRHIDPYYEAFSFSEVNWRSYHAWIHHVAGGELLSFQGIFDPDINIKLAPYWTKKDFEHLYKNDKWFDVKQVIISNKNGFEVYTGKQCTKNIYVRAGKGWCVGGNFLEHDNYDEYFDDSIINLTYEQLLTKIKQLPVKLDRRSEKIENKGNYFEYTQYHTQTNCITKRKVLYNNDKY